jgi:hypothetical protein
MTPLVTYLLHFSSSLMLTILLPLVALLSGAKTLGWDTQELLGNVFKTLVRFWLYQVYV